MYYLRKAGSLMCESCRVPLLTFLNVFKFLMVAAILINAGMTFKILEKAGDNTIPLCHEVVLYLNPSIGLVMCLVFYSVFKWL